MKSINERLSEVLLFLCKKDGYSPETLKRLDSGVLLPEDLEEIKKLRETVSYLKDYAKLQILTKSLGNSELYEKDIEEARNNANSIIHEALLNAEKTEQERLLLEKNMRIYKERIKSLIEAELKIADDLDKITL